MTAVSVQCEGPVTVLKLSRPPHNFFDETMIRALADAVEAADRDGAVRVCLLAAEGRNFCAGADFGGNNRPDPAPIYTQAIRLFARAKPLIAAINGSAVGGGLGLALVADMRVGTVATTFHANFTRLGIPPGFGITHTLPRTVGAQAARDMLLTGSRVGGEEARRLGLLDRLLDDDLQAGALAFARELAATAPTATLATRALLGHGERDMFAAAVARELDAQRPLFASPDFAEGVAAARERRRPDFSNPTETAP